MNNKYDHLELGQFIPAQYHFNMLNDTARMQGFAQALQQVVWPGAKVLELGGGTGVLSFFAARRAGHVWCVERNPELVAISHRILRQNPNGHKVEIIQADARFYVPPEPVDVVICEMLHVGLLREKQVEIIDKFKQRYLEKFGGPLPIFVPEACIQAFQLVEQDFNFEGYYAPTISFQDPTATQDRTQNLSVPTLFQRFSYEDALPDVCSWDGDVAIAVGGRLNAIRVITKNILAIHMEEQRSIDWYNQYLIVPLDEPLDVRVRDSVAVQFDYRPGAPLDALSDSLRVSVVSDTRLAVAL